MLIRLLPLFAGVIPVLAATLAYWLGAQDGSLPSCNPWLDGCTSISATGRHPPGSYVFRAVQLPFAAVLAIIWFFCKAWLHELGHGAFHARNKVMYASGLIASLALIVYVTFLGTTEPLYEFMRRFGIYLYFLGTALAQLMVSLTLMTISKAGSDAQLRRLSQQLLLLVALPFVLGILNLVLKATLDNPDMAENRIEWIASLCMQVWFVLLYLAWRRTGFDVSARLR